MKSVEFQWNTLLTVWEEFLEDKSNRIPYKMRKTKTWRKYGSSRVDTTVQARKGFTWWNTPSEVLWSKGLFDNEPKTRGNLSRFC